MSDALVLSVEILRVSSVKIFHALGQGWRARLNQQMIMIVRQALGV